VRKGTLWRLWANLATTGNGLCGVGSIAYTLLGNKLFGLFLILAGMAFDGLDGYFSRHSAIPGGVWGRVADSVADGITFCLAPAAAVAFDNYPRGLWGPWDGLALAVAGSLAAVGLYRLTVFTARGWKRGFFLGASTPQNALVLLVLVPLFQYPGYVMPLPPALLLGVLVFVPVMVLPVPYPKVRRGSPFRGLTGVLSGLVALGIILSNFHPSLGSVPYWVAYAATLTALLLLVVLYVGGPFAVGQLRSPSPPGGNPHA
jgi:phosphatidylserine synthase